MRRLLLLGALAAAVLVPAATAAPAATHTLKGTVIAKDSAHHALVVARAGGTVQTIVAAKAFSRTAIGRRVVIRFSTRTGALPTAVAVTAKGRARSALVHGTVVKLGKQKAVVNAGGSLIAVSLARKASQRQLTSARSGVEIGDEVEVEVEIGDDGGLGADTLESADSAAGGELEVRGTVTTLVEATATVPGKITVVSLGTTVTCDVPVGKTLGVAVGDLVELECALVGDPGVWTVRIAKSEDEHASSGGGTKGADGSFKGTPVGGSVGSGSGPDDGSSDEVEVRGTIAAPFTQLSTTVTITPATGLPVTCAITPGTLSAFTAGDAVKMECTTVAGVLTLKEIEKAGDSGKVEDENGGDDNSGDDGSGSGDDDGGHDGGGSDHGDD
jgi:hypothetical protein